MESSGLQTDSINAYVLCHSVLQTKTTMVKDELLPSPETLKGAELLSFLVLTRSWSRVMASSFLHAYADHCCQMICIFVQHVAFDMFKSHPSYLQEGCLSQKLNDLFIAKVNSDLIA